MRSFVIAIFLHACDLWALTAELEKRMEFRLLRREATEAVEHFVQGPYYH